MELTKSAPIRAEMQMSFQGGKSAKAFTTRHGYHITPSGKLMVDPAKAEVVTFIFEHFVKDDRFGKISDTLALMGSACPTGREIWSCETISKLLSNEKYVGDIILGKTQVIHGVQVKSHDADH